MKGSRQIAMLLVFITFLATTFAASAAGETVSFWTQSATNPGVLQVLDQFTKETGIKVEVKAIGWGTDELFVAMAGGAPPDLFTHGAAALGAFAGEGALSPLDSIISKWRFVSDMVPQIKEAGVYQGKQLVIAWNGVDVRDLIFRTDYFAQAGISLDKPPKNWTDLVSVGKKLVRMKPDGSMERSALSMAKGGTTAQQVFSMFQNQLGGSLLVNGKPALLDGTAEEALQFYVDLFYQYGLDNMSFNGSMMNGTSAMAWDNYGVVASLQQAGVDVSIATFPYKGKPSTFIGPNWAAIAKGASNPQGAAKLLEYLLRPESQQIMNASTGGAVPFYKQSLRWDWVKKSPIMVHYFNSLTYGVPNPYHPRWFDIRTVLITCVESALKRTQVPANALSQAQTQITAIVNETTK